MSDGGNEHGDDFEFIYLPKQPATAEQRIEVLESQVAELRQRIDTIMRHLPWLAASPKN